MSSGNCLPAFGETNNHGNVADQKSVAACFELGICPSSSPNPQRRLLFYCWPGAGHALKALSKDIGDGVPTSARSFWSGPLPKDHLKWPLKCLFEIVAISDSVMEWHGGDFMVSYGKFQLYNVRGCIPTVHCHGLCNIL